MIIGIPKEILPEEKRVAAIPETVAKYIKMGFRILVESSAGIGIHISDEDYKNAGAHIITETEELFQKSDIILKVKQPYFNEKTKKHEVDMLRQGCILITFLHPATPSNHETVKKLCAKNITSFTMDGIPRISRAQKMDALTSMSTITGYKSVLSAACIMQKFVPMIGTAIGTIKPAVFLVIGAGIVGLQAVATAKRLGAIIKAVDIREEARKEAASLGAKVNGFDVPPELAIGEEGYAKALSNDWLEKEREFLKPLVQEADAIILCALVPGEIAPVLVSGNMVGTMKPGSVIIDVSIDQGGNCEVTKAGSIITKYDVTVSGVSNIPGSVAVHSSWLYANNLYNYVENLFKKGIAQPDLEDEIVKHSLVTHNKKIVFKGALKAMGQL
jgi:NAD(P) transhydrogenase subunit alpha